ncbi:hypothetical protein Bra5_PD00882 (plasmid) [Rhizobium phaseoli Brasil 5]|nr:hypothetical protein Bra5_PD00882 [Rhizobium phaseoli Brasil 5]
MACSLAKRASTCLPTAQRGVSSRRSRCQSAWFEERHMPLRLAPPVKGSGSAAEPSASRSHLLSALEFCARFRQLIGGKIRIFWGNQA